MVFSFNGLKWISDEKRTFPHFPRKNKTSFFLFFASFFFFSKEPKTTKKKNKHTLKLTTLFGHVMLFNSFFRFIFLSFSTSQSYLPTSHFSVMWWSGSYASHITLFSHVMLFNSYFYGFLSFNVLKWIPDDKRTFPHFSPRKKCKVNGFGMILRKMSFTPF